jgi:PKD repeat protein
MAALAGAAVAVSSWALVAPGTARADSAPAPATSTNPTTVSADALPTVQINGVAWSQVVVGDTVYVAGSFTRARPAGAAPGVNESVRDNLLAYDIRTGALVPSFAPSLNAQALVVAASPDGSRVYVGGDFTSVSGQPRSRVAAFDTRTGALVQDFRPSVNSRVRALAATNGTVYLGGDLTAVGGVSRTRLAAVRASDGGLLPWAPRPGVGPTGLPWNRDGRTGTSNSATALVVTGNGAQVVAAGRWDTMGGVRATGVTALDPVTGANRGYAINTILTNQGINSAVYSLTTDGPNVYGTAYDYLGPGNLEGSFSVRASDGAINWVNTCSGDTYSSFAMGGALYHAGHPHNCAEIAGYPEQAPRLSRFATAVSLAPASAGGAAKRLYGGSWSGRPAPALLPWFPDMPGGTYTGQNQAGWSVTGNGQYLVYGGEFTRVNGAGQQGLVRFAVPSSAPNAVGPAGGAALAPSVSSPSAGVVRVSWRATSDPDNANLTYRVVRSDRPQPIHQVSASSTWWSRPGLAHVDRDVVPGQQYTYRIVAVDPFGNSVTSPAATVTVSDVPAASSAYASAVLADRPAHYWRLDDLAGARRAADEVGTDDLVLGTGVTTGSAGALGGTAPGTSATFDGTEQGSGAQPTRSAAPTTMSAELWFSTRSTTGGVLMDFSDVEKGLNGGDHDRIIGLDDAGRLSFAVWPGTGVIIAGPRSYNDGAWHHVVATHGAAGLTLYVDGELVAARADTLTGQATVGSWRVGGDGRWVGSTDWFGGRLDEVAVYPTQLSAAQVQRHWTVGRTGAGGANAAPTASFTATAQGLTAALDGRASVDRDGSITRYDWSYGDGTTGTGATVTHAYPRAGTYTVRLTVTDATGGRGSVEKQVTVSTVATGGSAITEAWTASGGAGGPLGVPVGSPYPTADGGSTQAYQNGRIHFSPATGAFAVYGDISRAYDPLRGESGVLGYPVGSRYATAGGGFTQAFQNGRIHFSPATGAHAVLRPVSAVYDSQRGESGRLGYPLGAAVTGPNGVVTQTFQHGRISVDAGGRATTTFA